MSRMRQVSPEDAIAVRTLGVTLSGGSVLDDHSHVWGQVVYATLGVMTVTTDDGAWVVPPTRAAWVPAHTPHRVAATGSVCLRTIYLRPDLVATAGLPDTCRVLAVSDLLRELILCALRHGMLRDDVPEQARLAAVILDQMRVTDTMPLALRWPRDPRARRIAAHVRGDLAAATTLAELARGSGASVRTLERLFTAETGLTFGRWRQQARLLDALRRLAGGESVTSTGLSVGFTSTSAFVSMFRRALGKTPGAWFRGER